MKQRVQKDSLHMHYLLTVHGIKAKEFWKIQWYQVCYFTCLIFVYLNCLILTTLLKNKIISELPCVKLRIRLSQFWRHQKGSPRWFLATIEAIHQLLIEYTEIEDMSDEPLQNYDNMLFFFRFMYEKIHQLYEHDKLKSYRRPVNV